jgi:tripartite-type tricarboxylate transporter receptor subunit TctC
VRGLTQPDMKARLVGQGVDIIAGTPEHFAAYIKSELTKWAKVIQTAGARVD